MTGYKAGIESVVIVIDYVARRRDYVSNTMAPVRLLLGPWFQSVHGDEMKGGMVSVIFRLNHDSSITSTEVSNYSVNLK
jgi:hypothetical protein